MADEVPKPVAPPSVPRMAVQQVQPGLWRWTAPHPDWAPRLGGSGGWEQSVGCVYYEAPGAVVLVDPLVPAAGTPDHDRFWKALDGDVARLDRPVAVLLCSDWHERSAQAVVERYGTRAHQVSIWAHPAARGRVACQVTDWLDDGLHEHAAGTSGAVAGGLPAALPEGVEAHALGIPYPAEVAYFFPEAGALVFGDAVVGVGEGALRVAPAWWAPKDAESQARYRVAFRPRLRRLLDLPIRTVLPSHGEPAMEHGRAALERALDASAWGE